VVKLKLLGASAVLALAAPLLAHHSPSAEFDMTKRMTLSGTLTKVDWVNPHIVVDIDIKGEAWKFESNPPAWFKRVGVAKIDFSKATGQNVTVECVRAKNGSAYGYMQKITFADGSSMELVNGAP
jgi:hypothetical protein